MTYFEPFPHHSLISETLSLCPLKFTVHYQQNSLYAQSLLRVFPSPFSKANLAHPLWGCCCPHNLLRDFVPLDLQVGEGSSFAPHCFFQAILLLSKSSPCSVIFFFKLTFSDVVTLFTVVVTYSLIDHSYFSRTLAFGYWHPLQHLSCPKSCCFQYKHI